MRKRMLLVGAATVLTWMALTDSAEAQLRRAPGAPSAPGAPVARGARGRVIDKPFANLDRGPTISPYLGLLRDNDFDDLPAYYAFVRPQEEQQALNRQQQRNVQQLDRDVRQMQGTGAFPSRGSTEMRETGHVTRYMNYLHYYAR